MQIPENNNTQSDYPVDKDTAKIAKESGQADNMDNPIVDEEAQNVVDGNERLSGGDAEKARQKANTGKE